MTPTVVTHISVDLDAITSAWLILRFLPGWDEADLAFTPQQTVWNDIPADSNPSVIYVDTGFGTFDHHQREGYTCAAKLVFDYLVAHNHIDAKIRTPLERIINLVNEFDHFGEVYFPEPDSDHWEMSLHQTISGLKGVCSTDEQIVRVVSTMLDATLILFQNKVKGEQEIAQGYIFDTRWGKALAMNTNNNEAMRLAQKKGYSLIITKDPEKGSVRIKTPPNPKLDLTPFYDEIKKADHIGRWFLHINKNMLLNGSTRSPGYTPSPLTLKQLIEIAKSVR